MTSSVYRPGAPLSTPVCCLLNILPWMLPGWGVGFDLWKSTTISLVLVYPVFSFLAFLITETSSICREIYYYNYFLNGLRCSPSRWVFSLWQKMCRVSSVLMSVGSWFYLFWARTANNLDFGEWHLYQTVGSVSRRVWSDRVLGVGWEGCRGVL